jgi:hypothetical protein
LFPSLDTGPCDFKATGGIAQLLSLWRHVYPFGWSQSLIANRVHSVLGVPLVLFEKKMGVIYLDARRRRLTTGIWNF